MTQSRIVLALALTLASQLASATATEPTSVSVIQLLRSPRAFDGKRVSVIGYYVNESGSHLFANAKASESLNSANIWVDESVLFNPGMSVSPPPPLLGISDVCELTKHYVRIVGRFRCTEANGRFWPELMGIMNFRVAFKSPDDPINPCGMYHKK
jgi:hypothetical protein